MTPPKKLSAPKAQTVKLNLKPSKNAERATPQERAKERATKLRARMAALITRFEARERKVKASLEKTRLHVLLVVEKLGKRVDALDQIASVDPAKLAAERKIVAARKRAEKLEQQLAELNKIIGKEGS